MSSWFNELKISFWLLSVQRMMLQVGARWKRWSSQHLQPCVGASTYLGYIAIFLAVLSKRPSLNQNLTKLLHEIAAHLDYTHVNIPQKSPRFLRLGKTRKITVSKTFPAFCRTGTCGACLWCVLCAGTLMCRQMRREQDRPYWCWGAQLAGEDSPLSSKDGASTRASRASPTSHFGLLWETGLSAGQCCSHIGIQVLYNNVVYTQRPGSLN